MEQGQAGTADDATTVPAPLGRAVPNARKAAFEAEVVLTAADPDGPPLPASAWPSFWFVTAQRPASGQRVRRWSTAAVRFEEWRSGGGGGDDGSGEDREPRRPRPDPGVLTATVDASNAG